MIDYAATTVAIANLKGGATLTNASGLDYDGYWMAVEGKTPVLKSFYAMSADTAWYTAHEPIFAVAGDCDLAHRVGREFLASRCQVDAVPADIVISTNGGYPLDQNIYQSVKGMTAAEATVKEGGVIIMLSKATDGHGGKSFHETFRDERDLNRMMQTFLDRTPEETIVDQWQSQIFARVLLKAKVIFVSSCDDQLVEDLHMIPAHSIEEALEKAKELVGKEDYKVTVIPDGVAVIVKE